MESVFFPTALQFSPFPSSGSGPRSEIRGSSPASRIASVNLRGAPCASPILIIFGQQLAHLNWQPPACDCCPPNYHCIPIRWRHQCRPPTTQCHTSRNKTYPPPPPVFPNRLGGDFATWWQPWWEATPQSPGFVFVCCVWAVLALNFALTPSLSPPLMTSRRRSITDVTLHHTFPPFADGMGEKKTSD